jgi:guanylate kinase
MKRQGVLYVISAPSGAGKTTICKEIVDIFPELRHSVSYTTRPPRAGEIDGRDYHFIPIEEFRRMVEAGEFAEWAEVHGNCYGTSLRTLLDSRAAGIDLILDIDCQGAAQLKKSYTGGVFIFILPPDYHELRRRLSGRNLDPPDIIELRLRNAEAEIRESRWYDYVIINDVFTKAAEELKSVIIAERCRTFRVLEAVTEKFKIWTEG